MSSHLPVLYISLNICSALKNNNSNPIANLFRFKKASFSLAAVCFFRCATSESVRLFPGDRRRRRGGPACASTLLRARMCLMQPLERFCVLMSLVWSCRTGFFFSLSINRATPSLARQPRKGQVQGGGGAGGASRYPAQGGAKGGRWDKRVQAVAACRHMLLRRLPGSPGRNPVRVLDDRHVVFWKNAQPVLREG